MLLTLWADAPQDRQLKVDARRACAAHANHAKAFPISRPRATFYLGIASYIGGRPVSARRLWRKTLAIAQRLHMPYETACAHWYLGQHTSRKHSNRHSHLDTATQAFRQLGIPWPEGAILESGKKREKPDGRV